MEGTTKYANNRRPTVRATRPRACSTAASFSQTVAEEEMRVCLRLCSASLPDSEAVPERAYLVDPVVRRVCGSPHPLRCAKNT